MQTKGYAVTIGNLAGARLCTREVHTTQPPTGNAVCAAIGECLGTNSVILAPDGHFHAGPLEGTYTVVFLV